MIRDPQKEIETKEKLKDAFFELYQKKRIDKIGIKEITDKAGFYRGTFYIHYKDIYDLLEQTENQLIEVISMFADNLMDAVFHGGDLQKALPPADFFTYYGKYMKVLIGPNGDPSFVQRLRDLVKDLYRRDTSTHEADKRTSEYCLEYIASGQIGLLTYWFQDDMEIPVTEIAKMIQTLITNGPLTLLSQK